MYHQNGWIRCEDSPCWSGRLGKMGKVWGSIPKNNTVYGSIMFDPCIWHGYQSMGNEFAWRVFNKHLITSLSHLTTEIHGFPPKGGRENPEKTTLRFFWSHEVKWGWFMKFGLVNGSGVWQQINILIMEILARKKSSCPVHFVAKHDTTRVVQAAWLNSWILPFLMSSLVIMKLPTLCMHVYGQSSYGFIHRFYQKS